MWSTTQKWQRVDSKWLVKGSTEKSPKNYQIMKLKTYQNKNLDFLYDGFFIPVTKCICVGGMILYGGDASRSKLKT